MRIFILLFTFLSLTAIADPENWKGQSPTHEFTGGVMGGMAIVGASVGGVLLGSISKKIIHRGFASEINDQVFVELQSGPIFTSGATFIGFSSHLRWDFNLNEDLAFYGLGGFGGFLSTTTGVSTSFFPRFGVGAMWNLEFLSLRAELSHEWMVLGASLSF